VDGIRRRHLVEPGIEVESWCTLARARCTGVGRRETLNQSPGDPGKVLANSCPRVSRMGDRKTTAEGLNKFYDGTYRSDLFYRAANGDLSSDYDRNQFHAITIHARRAPNMLASSSIAPTAKKQSYTGTNQSMNLSLPAASIILVTARSAAERTAIRSTRPGSRRYFFHWTRHEIEVDRLGTTKVLGGRPQRIHA
jgi:hypothetical protein